MGEPSGRLDRAIEQSLCDEITRLRAELVEAGALLGRWMPLPIRSQDHGAIRADTRAWLDRGLI